MVHELSSTNSKLKIILHIKIMSLCILHKCHTLKCVALVSLLSHIRHVVSQTERKYKYGINVVSTGTKFMPKFPKLREFILNLKLET